MIKALAPAITKMQGLKSVRENCAPPVRSVGKSELVQVGSTKASESGAPLQGLDNKLFALLSGHDFSRAVKAQK
jgi:hypothetical protein